MKISIPLFIILLFFIYAFSHHLILFSPVILIAALIGIIAGGVSKDYFLLFFSISLFIDFLKIKMLPFLIPFLPDSFLATSFFTIVTTNKFIINIRKLEYLAKQSATFDLAQQVAHDIKSPLSVLDIALNISPKSEQSNYIIKNAIHRIHDISNSLLSIERVNLTSYSKAKSQLKTHLVIHIIESIISEKRIQYRDKINIHIENTTKPSDFKLFALINISDLNNILSNLINNSIEAMKNLTGHIEVGLIEEDNNMIISVKDNGPGIPSNILNKLGEKGISYGKDSGHGLGIFHAKNIIESWNGKLIIQSGNETGTCFKISLPLQSPPQWFANEINIKHEHKIIIIDDEPTIHQIWIQKFDEFKLKNEIVSILNLNDARHKIQSYLQKDCEILLLVDFNFLNTKESGLDLVKELAVQNQSILVTSRSQDEHVIDECIKNNIKILPKILTGFIPITIMGDTPIKPKSPHAILIDDDDLVQRTWLLMAKKNNKILLVFKNLEGFMPQMTSIDKKTPIYIDQNLEKDVKGIDVAKRLYDLGFFNLLLTTGYNAENFKNITFLKAIVSKTPPWQ